MNSLAFINDIREAFDFLDDYARDRKNEINRRQLSKDSGLIKSYMIETQANGIDITQSQKNLEKVLRGTGWQLKSLDGTAFYHLNSERQSLGLIEVLSSRHLAIHSIGQTKSIDSSIRHTVLQSSKLDFAWLAGNYLQLVWEALIRERMTTRFVTFKFETESRFEGLPSQNLSDEDEDVNEEEIEFDYLERRSSLLSLTERVEKISRFLPDLQRIHPPFKAIKMLRIPDGTYPGGYEFWNWGKVTYRSPSFRNGRSYLNEITKYYQRATEALEKRVWFNAEVTQLKNIGEGISFTGTPILFYFPQPLPQETFINFVDNTFEKNQGPFRLWGNPIRLSEKKVHVYGIDMHLWERIYLELTPRRFLAVLPEGTCGNTIHRLVSNIQKYLAPDVETFIGEERYEALIARPFFGEIDF